MGRTEAEARKKAASMLGKSEEDLKLVRGKGNDPDNDDSRREVSDLLGLRA